MENNLMEIGKRFHVLKSEMLHGGYSGDLMDNHIIYVLSDELLSELGEMENRNVKKALANMFFLRQLSK